MIFSFFMYFFFVFFILQSIAFVTLFERHLLGLSQGRLGPSKVSFSGVLQAIMDGLKLLTKEQVLPSGSSYFYFLFFPCISFFIMFFQWLTLPFCFSFLSFGFSLLFFFCLVGFSVYGTMLSGILSKSKYSMIGAIRSSSQSVSYEIAFAFLFLSISFHLGVFSFFSFMSFDMFVLMVLYFILIIGELGRAPFDFSEGESELVSGYNTEYSSVSFVFLFLSEYGFIIFFCVLFSFLFFNGSILVFFFFVSFIIFVRSSFPRYRYDLMMGFFWYIILPICMLMFFYFFVLFL